MAAKISFERLDGYHPQLPVDQIVYLSKPASDPDGETTMIHLDVGASVLTCDSLRTLSARIEAHAPDATLWLDPVHSNFNAVVMASHITALSKPNPCGHDDDHTCVTLSTGAELLVHDSIRTLTAKLASVVGLELLPCDPVGGDYTEYVVANQVEHIMPMTGGRIFLHLTGGVVWEVRNDDGQLQRRLAVVQAPTDSVTAQQRRVESDWRPYCAMCGTPERMEAQRGGFLCTTCRSRVDYDLRPR